MAMNNVYDRFVHLASNKAYATMPARLRMNVVANPDKVDFVLRSLAVSPINCCCTCISSREKVLKATGVSAATLPRAARLGANISSV